MLAGSLLLTLGFSLWWLTRPQVQILGQQQLTVKVVKFSDLKGWSTDDHGAALKPFQKSCRKIVTWPKGRALGGFGGRASDWMAVCETARKLQPVTTERARQFFERNFKPVAVAVMGRVDGMFTGYFEPDLRGSRVKKAPFIYPLYGLPDDLIRVDLGEFRDNLKGIRIIGRLKGNRMHPYPKRSEIQAGALDGQGLEVVFVDSFVDVFFLQIQGSGRVQLQDGAVMRLGYAGSNGRRYYAIGRELIRRGILDSANVSMQSIRTGRSIAVDRQLIPLGAPIWLQGNRPSSNPSAPDRQLRRLMLAQDTGGAIKGGVRGDVFWGHGKEAAAIAGRMKHPGRWYVLIPNALADQL